jgi:hypothetical protein
MNANDPAFPTGQDNTYPGMTMRDYLAAHVITGVINDISSDGDNWDWDTVAIRAYAIVDAVIEESNKKNP